MVFDVIKQVFRILGFIWVLILYSGIIYFTFIKPEPTRQDLKVITLVHYDVFCQEKYNRGTYYQLVIGVGAASFTFPNSFHHMTPCQRVGLMLKQDSPLKVTYLPDSGQTTSHVSLDIYGLTGKRHDYAAVSDTLKRGHTEYIFGQWLFGGAGIWLLLILLIKRMKAKKRKPDYNDLM